MHPTGGARWSPWLILAAAVVMGCGASNDATSRTPNPPDSSAEGSLPEPVEPPAPGVETWRLPEWASSAPPFPYLKGEDRGLSRSIGDTTHGWLVGSVRVPQPHPHVGILRVQSGRDLDYTSRPMWELIEAAARYVDTAYPGSVLYLGNLGARGGGDIPYSVSHNSGRDADLAFYVTDSKGASLIASDLLSVDDDGRAVGPDGTSYRFDDARNWKLIEGLVKNGRGAIQYIFISHGLKKRLLRQAAAVGADADVVKAADELLSQPGGALPHNDHFHIRTYCTDVDVRSGCVDEGRRVSWFDGHAAARSDTISAARAQLESPDAEERLAATRRLELLHDTGSSTALEARLDDADPRVRAAAGRALAAMGRGEAAVSARLAKEQDSLARAELIWAVADYGSKSSVTTLAKLVDTPQPGRFADDFELDLRVLVADALAVADEKRPVKPLIALTKSDDAVVRERAHRALTMLTNFDPPVTESDLGSTWEAWYAKHGRLSRDQWLLLGFKARGHDVDRLALRHVWELATAVLDADYISYNAQKVLMRLSRRTPASLDWSKSDANFYWRRWFERRCKRLGCPPVPQGLSTLD